MLSYQHQVFIEVAKHLSFTKASEALFISQPAISKHIHNLEAHYKTPLFERKKGAVTLTLAGQILQLHLQTAASLAQQIEFDIGSIYNEQLLKGELKLGASTTIALYIIPAVLSAFRKQNEAVKMSLLNRNSENVMAALLNHEIDLAIVEGKDKMANVHSQYFLAEQVVAVCASGSHLAKQQHYQLDELKHMPLSLRERGSGTLTAIGQALAQHGLKTSDLNVCMRLGGTEALKNFILADDSLGFLPLKAVAKELERGELVQLYIDGLNIERHFYFVQRLGDENNGMNKAFIRFAKGHYNF
ncbi:LysR family transcriptional regulator [Pedobacter sp. KR3-3]|uniref:LysR family transcriptional regulator n=1 Tax=Pedobacter albus TaxID=3113905 RepID=A0ABU7I6B7_9SPHI|nr:LysR family transcriptional regulator [Pedobacter sp. KR3-3]MEE1944902.1 LysR family transcriptional regulator [Pedobacter sp. KR3-3]